METLDKIDWDKLRHNFKNKLTNEQYKLVCELHAKYYKHTYYEPCTCSPKTIKTWIAQLNDIYEQNTDDQ